jgi:hypothetical protein
MPQNLDAALIDGSFVLRRFEVAAPSMVYVRGIFEASDGVAIPFSMHGGEMVIATFAERANELDALLADLRSELGEQWLSGPEDITETWSAYRASGAC